jgi:hypothetical protein
MKHISMRPWLLVFLVFCSLSTPITYRGGAAAAHPHNFLQLWHDASLGSFAHKAHREADAAHAAHAHHSGPSPIDAAREAPRAEELAGRTLLTPFVVADVGRHAISTPGFHALESAQRRLNVAHEQTFQPSSHTIAPEPPPPR